MKRLDVFIQSLRIRKALPYIPLRSDILDIGCADGALFRMAGNHLRQGIGVDPGIAQEVVHQNFRLIPGTFPESIPIDLSFDVITMLAVFEHIDHEKLQFTLKEIKRILKINGTFILTTPASWSDKILHLMSEVNLISKEEIHEHKHNHSHEKIRDILIEAGFEKSKIKNGFFEAYMNMWFEITK